MSAIRKLKIFYFSGTGNARQIALWFCEFAGNRNIDCSLFNIANTDLRDLEPMEPDTLIFIISPIHGFNFPKITLNFIEHFPKGKSRIVLMNTRAGMKIGKIVTPGLTGIAFMLSSVMLRLKGYKIAGQIPFDMPSNWISLHPALNKNSVKFLHKKNYYRVEKYAGKLFSGKSLFLSYRDIVQDILIFPVSLGYYLIGRYAFAKTFYSNHLCDNCGLCSKLCPVQAIKVKKGRPFWTLKCESCMRCMNNCPKKAIDTAHGLFIGVSFLCSFLVTLLMSRSGLNFIQSEPWRSIVSPVLFIVLMCLFYSIQHLLIRNRTIAKIISFTSLTHYKFWGRYNSIKDEEWKK